MANNTKTTAVAFTHHNPTQQLLPHLLALVADMKACPPERGLWRTAVAAAIGDNLQFIDAGRGPYQLPSSIKGSSQGLFVGLL